MTIKGEVNKKWTSTDEYRNNFDRIFKKKEPVEEQEEPEEDPHIELMESVNAFVSDK